MRWSRSGDEAAATGSSRAAQKRYMTKSISYFTLLTIIPAPPDGGAAQRHDPAPAEAAQQLGLRIGRIVAVAADALVKLAADHQALLRMGSAQRGPEQPEHLAPQRLRPNRRP